MRTPISLEALEVLDAIDSKGSYSAAAAALNKVPSALSYTIQKLEQDLNVQLFQKQGRKSVLTDAGKLLVEQGRELLQAAHQLGQATRQLATGWEPRLRLAVDAAIPFAQLLPIFDQLYQLQPAIELEIHQEVLNGCWESLLNGSADLAIGATGAVPVENAIHSKLWLQTDSVFVCAPNHAICAEALPLSDQSIRKYRGVIIHDTSRQLPALNIGILNKENHLLVSNMEQKIAAHLHGLGVGTLPAFRAAPYLQSGQLRRLPTETKIPACSLHLAWRTPQAGRALSWLVERIYALRLS